MAAFGNFLNAARTNTDIAFFKGISNIKTRWNNLPFDILRNEVTEVESVLLGYCNYNRTGINGAPLSSIDLLTKAVIINCGKSILAIVAPMEESGNAWN
jgi:hypothetical protein